MNRVLMLLVCLPVATGRVSAGGAVTPPPARQLRAALAATLVAYDAPEVQLVRDSLDSWSGVGLVLAGMTHQRWDVQLTA